MMTATMEAPAARPANEDKPKSSINQDLLGQLDEIHLWSQLRDLFDLAYGPPRNEDLIKRIYDYADWCCQQPSGTTAEDDLATCVAVSFYEHIPECQEALQDMPRWFTLDDVRAMRDTFSYMVGEEGYQRILQAYSRQS